jgi:hypothetical protein
MLVLKTSCPPFHSVLDEIRPDELDYSRIVVAVREIVIESRETMLLTCFLHTVQLAVIEFVRVDVAHQRSDRRVPRT